MEEKSHLFCIVDENKHNNNYSLTTLIFNKNNYLDLIDDIHQWYMSLLQNKFYKTFVDMGWLSLHFSDIKNSDLNEGIPWLDFYINKFILLISKIQDYCYIRTLVEQYWTQKSGKSITAKVKLLNKAINPYNRPLLEKKCGVINPNKKEITILSTVR